MFQVADPKPGKKPGSAHSKTNRKVLNPQHINYFGVKMVAPEDVTKYIASNDIKWVDLQFTDIIGTLHRFAIPGHILSEDSFSKGVSGPNVNEIFKGEEISELRILPDANGFARIPWENSSIRVLGSTIVAITEEKYLKDSRYVIEHMETSLKAAGITTARMNSEVEFYLFDAVSSDKTPNGQTSSHLIESREGIWNPSPITSKEGAYANEPFDMLSAVRAQIADTMSTNFKYPIDYHCHGRAKTAQQKVAIGTNTLKNAADAFMTLKYITRNAAFLANTMATFMPLPLSNDKGSSMQIGSSLWKKDRNAFYDSADKYAQISQVARYYIGGILEHGASLSLFINPTINSYKRLKRDRYYLAWSKHNNNSIVKVPNAMANDDIGKKVMVNSADPSVNPYLAYAAIIAAGLDGIKKKSECGDPIEENIDRMDDKKRRAEKIKLLPESFNEAMEAIESDIGFLKGVIPTELLSEYLDIKLEEVKLMDHSVTSYEVSRYFNI